MGNKSEDLKAKNFRKCDLQRKIFNECISLLKKSSEENISEEDVIYGISQSHEYLNQVDGVLESISTEDLVVKKWIQSLNYCLNHSLHSIRIAGTIVHFLFSSMIQRLL